MSRVVISVSFSCVSICILSIGCVCMYVLIIYRYMMNILYTFDMLYIDCTLIIYYIECIIYVYNTLYIDCVSILILII